ncbi:hypothetical protein L596_000174 [Steinernema carpocapsae]|uniref:UDP-glucuronosyltransferase n=1 Tax=Steinernema carpocapsae TaxID=34508 RepID=A0A4U8ULJ9_STECR|nr:hypothetical protein L596_000174 [Steinernema carpocapsae]
MEEHKNVHLVPWMDQTTILAQPQTKAFITHCGLNSLTETIHSGVPVLAIPLFGDQQYNAAIVKYRQFGENIAVREVTESTLYALLTKILKTDTYRNTAQKFKRMLKKRPNNPREEVRKWVTFAAEFPDLTMMNLHGSELSFITYYSLDIIALSFLAATALLLLAMRVTMSVSSFLIKMPKNKKTE